MNIMMTRTIQLITILIAATVTVFSQSATQNDDYKKHFIGSSVFILANLAPDPPNYYQLNYGYRITPKDVISIEAITWEYKGPIGRPYGKDFENENSNFPGSVKAYGIGLAYKRFLWKKMYVGIHSTAFHQNYLDKSKKKIQSGFQLFNTLRFGYQFQFFNNRVFIEPSVAFTYWPINTNLPDSFQKEENKWPNFFLFEPGLHFGINF